MCKDVSDGKYLMSWMNVGVYIVANDAVASAIGGKYHWVGCYEAQQTC